MSANFAYLNTRDLKFIAKEWLPTEKIFSYPRYSEYYSKDDVDAILDPCLKMAKELIEPTNEDGDSNPIQFENGKVKLPPSFGPLFKQLQSEGWGTSNIDESEGAMVMPEILYAMVWEMFCAANPTFGPYIISVSYTHLFITGGDQDITENIVHLVLARVEGARPGTKGISLFAVPKMWVDDDGNITGSNDVACIGIEHKMGIKGSATCVMSFGENNECRGYILGNPPDEEGKGEGMAQMFQMMNGARMETGHAALAETAVAFHNAASYANERIQGRLITDPKAGRQLIIKHEDVRRMLLDLKAHVDAMRALIFKTYYYFDILDNTTDPEEKQLISGRIDIHTPLVKAYCSDKAWELCAEAMQVFGGNGYSEEYPIAELARDVKIYSIWEGTNFIQSMDLVLSLIHI